MSKISVDTSLTETLVCKAPNLETAIKIRGELVLSSSFCWFFLYSHTCEIYVCNEFGGKINPDTLEKLKAIAEAMLTSSASKPSESMPS